MSKVLSQEIVRHWQQLRGMTYDFMELISDKDLKKRLPFPESQDIFFQLNCMLGAQESNLSLISEGVWEGFSSSLDDKKTVTVALIFEHMRAADRALLSLLNKTDLLAPFSDGSTPLQHYLVLVEHESHHQGQLINFIYACGLPVPQSWHDKWALTK